MPYAMRATLSYSFAATSLHFGQLHCRRHDATMAIFRCHASDSAGDDADAMLFSRRDTSYCSESYEMRAATLLRRRLCVTLLLLLVDADTQKRRAGQKYNAAGAY